MYLNWLSDSMMLMVLPSADAAQTLLDDWEEVASSEESDSSSDRSDEVNS